MGKYLFTRLLATIPLLLGLTLLVFSMIHLIPGSAAVVLLDDAASTENVAALEAEPGLDDPLPIQYSRWISGVLSGDLGTSLINKRPVQDALVQWSYPRETQEFQQTNYPLLEQGKKK
jgi:peptide/nickel transport system permease protein